MPYFGSSKLKRLAAGSMALVMLVILLLSAFFIAAEAHHDCCGEDCPICACIAQCEKTIHQMGNGISVSFFAAFAVSVILITVSFIVFAFLRETPVSSKVRMNN